MSGPCFGDVAEDRGVDLAVEQHLLQVLPLGRPLDVGRIAVLGQMRVLERDPRHALEIDAVVLGEETAHPRAGRLGVGADTDALAAQIAGRQRAAVRVVEDRVMLIAADDRRRQQHVRLAVLVSLQIGDDGELPEVVLAGRASSP